MKWSIITILKLKLKIQAQKPIKKAFTRMNKGFVLDRGRKRNRTAVEGFADLCLTARSPDLFKEAQRYGNIGNEKICRLHRGRGTKSYPDALKFINL